MAGRPFAPRRDTGFGFGYFALAGLNTPSQPPYGRILSDAPIRAAFSYYSVQRDVIMTKSEKQKMLSRELYNPNCGELVRDRLSAKDLCFRFNQLPPSDIERQRDIIMRLLQAPSRESFLIMAPFWCDYGYNIRLGNNFFANHNTVILDCAPVTFGDNVLIGPNCGFYAAQHPVDAQLRNRGGETAAPISVGNNVWIGGGAQIMPGVTIGDNAVIGGGSVVVKDIPPDCIAVGNPCKPMRAL